MMSMGGEGSIIDRLKQLHLVPLSISYEYDPCDFLKAKEFQQKRDNADWKKGPMDDLVSMQTGIFGYKGHVHYHAAPCLDDYLDSLDSDMPKQDIYNKVAAYMDEQIFKKTTASIRATMWLLICLKTQLLIRQNILPKIRQNLKNIWLVSLRKLTFQIRMKLT